MNAHVIIITKKNTESTRMNEAKGSVTSIQ